MNSKYKITVGIISYNRPLELLRTVKSLLPLPPFVEVIICDDRSPKILEILNIIESLITDPNIRFISNKVNLGYDRNLFQVIELAESDKVLLLGDDDYLENGVLDNIIKFIDSNTSFECAFLKFRDINATSYQRCYNTSRYFDSSRLAEEGSFLFNSILFSGLIFSKKNVVDNTAFFDTFFKSIYIQVAIFIFLNSKFGSYFIDGPGVIIGGDGESGFGFNQASSNHDVDLKDRTSVISNLSYHKRLINVVKVLEKDAGINVYKPFIKEYKIRSVKAFFTARKYGREYTLDYWKSLRSLGIPRLYFLSPIYFIIYMLPYKLLVLPISIVEKIFFDIRVFK